MGKTEIYNREKIGKVMECLLGNYNQIFDMDEALAGHKEYSKSMDHGMGLVRQLAAMDRLRGMAGELEEDIMLVRDYAAQAGYMQGVKDGLSLIRFAVSPKETLTVFGESIKFQSPEGGKADVQ